MGCSIFEEVVSGVDYNFRSWTDHVEMEKEYYRSDFKSHMADALDQACEIAERYGCREQFLINLSSVAHESFTLPEIYRLIEPTKRSVLDLFELSLKCLQDFCNKETTDDQWTDLITKMPHTLLCTVRDHIQKEEEEEKAKYADNITSDLQDEPASTTI